MSANQMFTDKRLNKSNFKEFFKIIDVPGNGTCFYTSFAIGYLNLRGKETTHYMELATLLRKMAGDKLCPLDAEYKMILEAQSLDPIAYCKNLLEENPDAPTYADEKIIDEILAFTEVDLKIYYKQKNAQGNYNYIIRGLKSGIGTVNVLLQQTPNDISNHYTSLLPKEGAPKSDQDPAYKSGFDRPVYDLYDDKQYCYTCDSTKLSKIFIPRES
jgi:hypothetical protein